MLQAPSTIEDTRIGSSALESSRSPVMMLVGSFLLSAGLLLLPWWFGILAAFQYLFLVLALSVGFYLYRSYPVWYVGYTWWLWFLTPFVRRLVDYYSGGDFGISFVRQTIYLVSGLSILALYRHRDRLLDKAYFPFALALVAVAYAYVIGIVSNGIFKANFDAIPRIAPVFFGLHVAFCWRDYPAMRRCIQRTFLWGVVVMGAYALLQFYVMPSWDKAWMLQSDLTHTSGSPAPFQVRVFSTVDSHFLFAPLMMAGLLVLFSLPHRKHLPAAVLGYPALLLTLHRQTWGAWLMALALMALWFQGRLRTRLLRALLLGALIVVPLLSFPEITQRINRRFETFQNIEGDASLNVRLQEYQRTILLAWTNPVGTGFGFNTRWDAGLVSIPYKLGWPGTLLLGLGLVLLVRYILRGRRRTGDPFAAVSTAIALAILAMLPFRDSFYDVGGAVFWCFAGLSVASYRYHRAQEDQEEMEALEAEMEPEMP